MELTQEQRAILAHVVPDVDVWVSHALENVGEHAVLAKIQRWRDDYMNQCSNPNYKNRAERAIEEQAALAERILQRASNG